MSPNRRPEWPTIEPKERNLYDRTGFLLRRAQQLFAMLAAKDLDRLELTLPQIEALAAIGSAASPDQVTVARSLGLDAATVTLVIDGLERKKLAARGAHEDRRRRVLRISPRGRRILGDALPRLRKVGEQLLSPLSRAQAAQLLRDLNALARHPGSAAPEWVGPNEATAPGRATPLDEVLRAPGFLIRRALQVCNTFFNEETPESDITTQQYATLAAIAGFPDLDQAMLTEVTWSGKSTAVPILRILDARGYIARVGAVGDARRRVFRLQDKGDLLLKSVYAGIRRSEQKFLAPLPASRAVALQQRVRQIVLAHGALHLPSNTPA